MFGQLLKIAFLFGLRGHHYFSAGQMRNLFSLTKSVEKLLTAETPFGLTGISGIIETAMNNFAISGRRLLTKLGISFHQDIFLVPNYFKAKN